jgi:hypothetical protein
MQMQEEEMESSGIREGSEDMPKGKHSRKRGMRGAKHTKAPMDGEGCSCGAGKGKKCSCDGGCGSYKKMDSALTPHEYLAACELNIQDRSRQYIRARLDVAERRDLKCGNGSISPGEKCHVGTAQQTKKQPTLRDLRNDPYGKGAKFWKTPGSTKGVGNKIKRAGELAANVGGGVALGLGSMQLAEGIMTGNIGKASRGLRNYNLGLAASSLAGSSRAARQGNTQLSKEYASQAGKLAAFGVGQEMAIGGVAGYKRARAKQPNMRTMSNTEYQAARQAAGNAGGDGPFTRARGAAGRAWNRSRSRTVSASRGNLPGRRDSIYATGFTPEYDQLAV